MNTGRTYFKKGNKGYWLNKKRSEATKEKIRLTKKGKHGSPNTEFKKGHKSGMMGKHHSEQTKEKIHIALLKSSWNKGKRGLQVGWYKGKHRTEETKLKLRLINLGRKHTTETKLKMSSSHVGMKGKTHSEETKKKISEANKGHKYNIGHRCSDETKRKISIANTGKGNHIGYWKNKRLSIETKEKLRHARLNYVFPQKDTILELKLQNALTERGISFTKHKPITGQPDIFIEPNICIFADGCYWHSCEQCFDKNKFTGKQRAKIVYDQLVTQKLQNDGYIVLRFSEHEINKNIESCVMKIINEVEIVKMLEVKI